MASFYTTGWARAPAKGHKTARPVHAQLAYDEHNVMHMLAAAAGDDVYQATREDQLFDPPVTPGGSPTAWRLAVTAGIPSALTAAPERPSRRGATASA
jgi:hypothetical protein